MSCAFFRVYPLFGGFKGKPKGKPCFLFVCVFRRGGGFKPFQLGFKVLLGLDGPRWVALDRKIGIATARAILMAHGTSL